MVLTDDLTNVKVIDFGMASPQLKNQIEVGPLSDFTVGTPEYMAPELFDPLENDISKVDVYSAAKVLINMLHGLKFPLPSISLVANGDPDLENLL